MTLSLLPLWIASAATAQIQPGVAASQPALYSEVDTFRLVAAPDGRSLHLVARPGNEDCTAAGPPVAFCRIRKAGQDFAASKITPEGDQLRIEFAPTGFSATLRLIPQRRHVVVEVIRAEGDDRVDEFSFADIPLALKGATNEPLAACALALNLKTNVHELPGANSRLRALCYRRFGMVGAKAAIVAAPPGQLRTALQEAVKAADDVPHSPLGGPWALDAPINQGSYLFNFDGLTEATAEEWIRTARACGMNQIDFHGGQSFRFGDVHFNPKLYPRGKDSMRAVIDKLHGAGIKAGLHTYAFFIDKASPYVTPVPDKRLGKDAAFTLTADLRADAKIVPVNESTEKMSTTTGFFVPNSVTLQIDDELIIYGGIDKQAPFAFTGCQRGAYGTKPADHARGAKVEHLRECFGLFLPDGDSTLFEEIAAKTAEAFNDCGFDMMYLDALDGEGVVAGPDAGWHYGSKFVFELWKRLKRPALMEMSTFHHHLWYVRSRYVAWDHPNRGHKPFIDLHCRANEESRRMFLPGHLGWWAVITWTGDPQVEPTYPDDLEYLCAKALATDTGFSLMGLNPQTFKEVPAFERLAGITRRYEELRHGRYFPEALKEKLRQPEREFTLTKAGDRWAFRPVQYLKHTADRWENGAHSWTVNNPFGRQPVKLRIEALKSVAPYDDPRGQVVIGRSERFEPPEQAPGLTVEIKESTQRTRRASLQYTARSQAKEAAGSWTCATRSFSPPLDLSRHQGLGFWIHGDGLGEVLNLQLRSPEHLVAGYADHYVPIDFAGWRYVELVEAEGERCPAYRWPYSAAYYDLYRENVQYNQVSSLGLWYNNVPPGQSVTCHLGEIKALPLVDGRLINPTVTIGSRTMALPVPMVSGYYLEFSSPDGGAVFGPKGNLVSRVAPEGAIPELAQGENRVTLRCGGESHVNPRVRVVVIAEGEPLE